MKIAFVTHTLIVGGAETYILRKAEWLINAGNEVIILSEGGCFVDMLPKSIRHITISNISLPPYSLSQTKLNNVLNTIAEILFREKVDVVETHNPYAAIYTLMSYSKSKRPFLLNVLLELSYDRNWELCKLTRILDKKGAYYTLTKQMNLYIEKRCHKNLTPIILPIPLNDASHNSVPYNSSNYILTVGRLASDKMYLKYLIKDFGALLTKTAIDVTLVVVGDGALRNEIDALANNVNESLNREAVIILGTVVGKDLEALYANCLLYVGVGTTLLLGASYAKPTIIASGIKDCQQYAYGFWGKSPEEDVNIMGGNSQMKGRQVSYESILSRFFQMSDKQKSECGIVAHKLFSKHYDLNVIMEKWNEEYLRHSKRPVDKVLCRYAYVFYVLNIILYPIYQIYSLRKKIFGSYEKHK